MRRLLKHGFAWTLSTAVAGTVSWWGVHTVVTATAYTPPPALPAAQTPGKGQPESPPGTPSGDPTATLPAPARPGSAGDDAAEAERRPAAGTSTGPAPSTGPTAEDTAPAGEAGDGARTSAEDYTVDGGRVTFDMREDHAELVSATPHPGWRTQVWKHPQWIRVSFTDGAREISVFCTWYQHAPLVEIEER